MINRKRINIFTIILMIVFVIWFFIKVYYGGKDYNKLSFKGIVERVKYDEKGYCEIWIQDNSYPCLCSKYDCIIEIGDSIFKHKNSNLIEIYKNNILYSICGD